MVTILKVEIDANSRLSPGRRTFDLITRDWNSQINLSSWSKKVALHRDTVGSIVKGNSKRSPTLPAILQLSSSSSKHSLAFVQLFLRSNWISVNWKQPQSNSSSPLPTHSERMSHALLSFYSTSSTVFINFLQLSSSFSPKLSSSKLSP